MAAIAGHQLGVGPLTAVGVVRVAMGMLRLGYRRVAAVALLLFAVPVVSAAVAEEAILRAGGSGSLLTIPVAVVAAGAAVALRLLGPVAYSGYLDQAVGVEYLLGRHQKFGEVIRSLPLLRLLVADVIVTAATSVGLVLLVVPGLVFYVLFGLVGPVLVQEQLGLLAAFRRTFRLSRTAPGLIAVLVLVPFAFEEALHEVAHHALESAGLGAQVLAEWLLAVIVGALLGLVEVALAAELIARHPEPTVR